MGLELTDLELNVLLDALENGDKGVCYYEQNRHIHAARRSLIIKVNSEIGSRYFLDAATASAPAQKA